MEGSGATIGVERPVAEEDGQVPGVREGGGHQRPQALVQLEGEVRRAGEQAGGGTFLFAGF